MNGTVNKVFIVTIAIILIIASVTIYYSYENRVKHSGDHLKNYIVKIIPLGTSMDEAQKKIKEQGWEIDYVSYKYGYPSNNDDYENLIGKKSIRANIGDRRMIIFSQNITVFFGFDENERLVNVSVWRTVNGF